MVGVSTQDETNEKEKGERKRGQFHFYGDNGVDKRGQVHLSGWRHRKRMSGIISACMGGLVTLSIQNGWQQALDGDRRYFTISHTVTRDWYDNS